MSNRLRRKSRPQADVELYGGPLKQTSFKGAMNIDRPASEIGDDQVAYAENVIFFDKHIESRPGTLKASQVSYKDAAYTGTYHSASSNANSLEDATQHSQYFVHRGSKLWALRNPIAAMQELQTLRYDGGSGSTLGLDVDSCIRPISNGSALFTKSGIYFSSSHVSGIFKMNSPNPVFGFPDSNGGTAHERRYLVTLSRIVTSAGVAATDRVASNAILEHESGSNDKEYYSAGNHARSVDYGVYTTTNTVSATNPISITNAILQSVFSSTSSPTDNSAALHFTHASIYATLDVNATNGFDKGGQANNTQLYIWVGDVKRNDIFASAATFSDTSDDETLRARLETGYFGLKTRGFQPIPSGACAEVTPGFMFVSDRESSKSKSTVYYCQLSSPETMGYYFPGSQFKVFKDTVTAMHGTQDILSIFALNSTHTCTLTSYTQDASKVTPIFTLTNFSVVDDTVGVRDWETLARVDKNTMIGVCSDSTVRLWDTNKWGNDVSTTSLGYTDRYGKDVSNGGVNSEIRKIVPADPANVTSGSCGRFANGQYILAYSKNSSDTYLTNFLRLGFGGRAGFGWSFYTGFLTCPFRCGMFSVVDDANRIKRLMGISSTAFNSSATADHIYWLDTYNTYTGAQDATGGSSASILDKQETDARAKGADYGSASGLDIACKVRFREMIGNEEADTLIHRESHVYFRPIDESVGFKSGFQINFVGYANGSVTAADTVSNIPKTGDIHFNKEVSGRRVQIEFQTTTSQWRLVGVDSHFRSLDKINFLTAGNNSTSESTTSDASIQATLAGMTHWFTRRQMRIDRVTGNSLTVTGSPSTSTGPDGKSGSAFFCSIGAALSIANTDALDGDFSLLFGLKFSFSSSNDAFISGTDLSVSCPTATSINFSALGSITIPTVDNNLWRMFSIVRSGTAANNITIRDGITTVGTISSNAILSMANLSFGAGPHNVNLFDIRFYSSALTLAQITYWYNDVINNSGNLVCPQV